MKKIINGTCVVLAFLSVLLGLIGMALPILPTTPFFMLAAVLFAKSSKRFHVWFTKSNLYRRHIERTIKNKEMTRAGKISVLGMMTVVFVIGFLFSPVYYAKVIIGAVAAGHYYYFLFRIKTVEEPNISEDSEITYKEK